MFLFNLPSIPSLLPTYLLDSLFRAFTSACFVSMLNYIVRMQAIVQSHSQHQLQRNHDSDEKMTSKSSWKQLSDFADVAVLTVVLTFISHRVAALLVMESSAHGLIRLISSPMSACECFASVKFALGCSMLTTLKYLYEESIHTTLNMAISSHLASLMLMKLKQWHAHIDLLYALHSDQKYCGLCALFHNNWQNVPSFMNAVMKRILGFGTYTSIMLINQDFTSTSNSLRFWLLLIICYGLLTMQKHGDEPSSHSSGRNVFGMRMIALFVITLTVGNWEDILHIPLVFLGEMWYILYSNESATTCENTLETNNVQSEDLQSRR
uniref:transmembrane protein 82 n=1 Tax=Myxine glutinosa TaxID=7769 RepID=UPI00358F79D6